MPTKNPAAKSLSKRRYGLKIVKPKKGKGSYTRKGKGFPSHDPHPAFL